MLTVPLLGSIAGLAAVDSLNPATIAGVALILLAPLHRPAATALAYVTGAYAVVLGVGAAIFIGSDALGEALDAGTTWIRRGALLLAAAVLAVSGIRRLRNRQRAAMALPAWFGPWTAAPVGVLVTGADLPNAFPYLIAIERLTAASVPTDTGIAVLALYGLVYCLPCLLLLIAGLAWRGHITVRLQRLYQRLGAARTLPRSVPVALTMLVLASTVAGLAISL